MREPKLKWCLICNCENAQESITLASGTEEEMDKLRDDLFAFLKNTKHGVMEPTLILGIFQEEEYGV